jgi:hypothetical protein
MLGGSFIVGNQSEASKYAAKNYADPEKFPRPMYASLKDMEKVRAFLFFFTDLIKGVVQQYDVVFIQVDLDGIQYLSIFDLLHGGIRECGVIPFFFLACGFGEMPLFRTLLTLRHGNFGVPILAQHKPFFLTLNKPTN